MKQAMRNALTSVGLLWSTASWATTRVLDQLIGWH